MMRGFPDRLMDRLREHPSSALLTMLEHRLRTFDHKSFQMHQDKCDVSQTRDRQTSQQTSRGLAAMADQLMLLLLLLLLPLLPLRVCRRWLCCLSFFCLSSLPPQRAWSPATLPPFATIGCCRWSCSMWRRCRRSSTTMESTRTEEPRSSPSCPLPATSHHTTHQTRSLSAHTRRAITQEGAAWTRAQWSAHTLTRCMHVWMCVCVYVRASVRRHGCDASHCLPSDASPCARVGYRAHGARHAQSRGKNGNKIRSHKETSRRKYKHQK